MTQYSVLDLAPITLGSTAAQAMKNTVELAQHAEKLGFNRYWLAEHHNMPGIASAATSVLIGHVAGATQTIRVGAGGIMLPNHSPLVIAEQFGTLASLYPNRIDLGLGRAPGTDQATSFALRRNLNSDAQSFPQDVVELLGYFGEPATDQRVRAYPGAGLNVPVWILGSSLFGAQLAAMLGLPYAFASHFAPGDLEEAIALYRHRFEPSRYLDKPYVMAGFNVFAADSDAEATLLFSSIQQAFVNLRTGNAGQLPPPVANYAETLDPRFVPMINVALACSAVGSVDTVQKKVADFVTRTEVDELMITAQIFDHQARLHSFELLAQAINLSS
ncbi:LLM class flavin-dependent oxidoreductase [Pseudochrobactrum sp. MP213Fo]|uniref:LLM class flavin-dependent oxidoreductase n=1 Tax=Pseudochrobactrum sp. MP213Fo TaxID=3022250 RepID=UPI003BA0FDFC